MAVTRGLTEAQIKATDDMRDEWLGLAESTERCDRAAAQEAVLQAYRSARLTPPRLVVWMDSPLGGALAYVLLLHQRAVPLDPTREKLTITLEDAAEREVRRKLGRRPTEDLLEELDDHLNDLHGNRLKRAYGGLLRDQGWGHGWGPEWHQLDGALRERIAEQLTEQLSPRLGDLFEEQRWKQTWNGGMWQALSQHIGPWTSPYQLARWTRALQIADLPVPPRLDALTTAVRSAGWWWPLADAVVLTDRPTVLQPVRDWRPDGDDGPALAYADGLALQRREGWESSAFNAPRHG